MQNPVTGSIFSPVAGLLHNCEKSPWRSASDGTVLDTIPLGFPENGALPDSGFGGLLGKVLDSHFRTGPWLLLLCLGLGFAVAGVEVARLLKLAHSDDDSPPEDKSRPGIGKIDKKVDR